VVHAVLFVEDDVRFQKSIAALLPTTRLHITFTERGRDAIAMLPAVAPDACVVDLGLPDMPGEALIRELVRLRPGMPVVVLSIASSETKIMGALRAGAMGYILKEDVVKLLPRAIDEAMEGGAPMSAAVARLALIELRASHRADTTAKEGEKVLTPREIEVVEYLARGLSYADVGMALGISPNTVRAHIRSIYDKLVVASKTEAVMAALRLGLLQAHG
jgi:DNA-binding NarL/FixJ family response regulator